MKILHLSTSDHGGAGAAAFRFHKNIVSRGIDSRMLVLSRQSGDATVVQLEIPNVPSRICRLASKALLKIRTNPDYYFQDQSMSGLSSKLDYFDEINFYPDLIVAHWVSNFVSVEDLYRLSGKGGIPVLWYLMDMAPLTGGCHYAWDCEGYKNQCGNCPALYSSDSRDLSSRNWRKKQAYIQRMNVTTVAGSWLIGKAGMASLFTGKRKENIMLGVDSSVFLPGSRTDARKSLGLPADKKILFVGSQSMKQKRKGMQYFLDAMRILEKNKHADKENMVILTAGDATLNKSLRKSRFRSIHLGFLGQDELVRAYQAADVFVCPSVEDAGPGMVKQSIMCGTPVVSFKMGVAGDLVRTNSTGYCAILMDSGDLARGIVQILNLNSVDAEIMSSNCRDTGLRLCNEEVQVDKFMCLANAILAEHCG